MSIPESDLEVPRCLIREKALGPEHPDVAISLNNLAGLYCWAAWQSACCRHGLL